jgi:hypothetical protein
VNALSCHAQKRTRIRRPDANAACSVWRDVVNAASDARGRRRREKAETGKTATDAAGIGSRGKSENKPAQVTAKAAGRAKGKQP